MYDSGAFYGLHTFEFAGDSDFIVGSAGLNDVEYLVVGGAGGDGKRIAGNAGGSEGGASFDGDLTYVAPAPGVAGQGNSGGLSSRAHYGGGAGGGGAGAAGYDATEQAAEIGFGGNGGDGRASSISGVLTYYAGGGAGASNTNSSSSLLVPQGGLGGGGNGSASDEALGLAAVGDDGVDGLGGGGGGGDPEVDASFHTSGGSGVVILRYDITDAVVAHSTVSATSGEVQADGVDQAAVLVRLLDDAGANVGQGGATVAIDASLGQVSSVTDHGDGSYTAAVTSVFSGTSTITATVNGQAIAGTGAVVFSGGSLGGALFTSLDSFDFLENGTGAIGAVTSTDSAPPITYAVTGGADQSFVDIDAGTGVLTFNANVNNSSGQADNAPDFEGKSTYVIEVTASDGTLPSANTSIQVITINILDQYPEGDDEGPVFTSSEAVSVLEGAVGAFLTIEETDSTEPVKFAITGGADQGLFSLSTASNGLSFIASPDFETPADADGDNEYVVEVTASDGVTPTNTSVQTIRVTVTDDPADNSGSDVTGPVFTSADFVAFAENQVGTVLTIAASDQTPAITYDIWGGDDSALFSIDSSSGELTLDVAQDFESPIGGAGDNSNNYNLIIRASDGVTPTANTSFQTITVSVIDVAERVSFSTSTLEVNEGGAAGIVDVQLNYTPISDVIIPLVLSTGTLAGAATLDTASVTFTSSDTAGTTKAVQVTPSSSDGNSATDEKILSFGGLPLGVFATSPSEVEVSIVDFDLPGFTISQTGTLNLIEGATGDFTVVLNSPPSGGDATVTIASTDSGAVSANPTGLTFNSGNFSTAQTVTLTAVDDYDAQNETTTISVTTSGANYDSLSAQDFLATVTDIYSAEMVLTTEPVGGASGEVLATQPVITLRDSAGNTAITDSSSVVTVTLASGSGGSLGGTLTATAVNGVVTFADVSLSGVVGTDYTFDFTSGSLTTITSGNVQVSGSGSATEMVITTEPVGGASGEVLATQPVIRLRDSAGNTAITDSSSVVTVTLASGSGGSLGGTLTATAVNGVVTFADVSLSGVVGTDYTFDFASGSLTTITSGNVQVSGSGSVAKISIRSGNAQAARPGASIESEITVLVTDSSGNFIGGHDVVFAVTSGGGSIINETQVTNALGIATLPANSWTLGDAGDAGDADELTVTVGSVTAIIVANRVLNAVPTANAGADQNVVSGETVILSGSGADSDGEVAAYSWTQTGGTTVTLSSTATNRPTFTAPTVDAGDSDVKLTFSLVAIDNEGTGSTSDTVEITVNSAILQSVDSGGSLSSVENSIYVGKQIGSMIISASEGGLSSGALQESVGEDESREYDRLYVLSARNAKNKVSLVDWFSMGMSETSVDAELKGDGTYGYAMFGSELSKTTTSVSGLIYGIETSNWEYETESDVEKSGLSFGYYSGRRVGALSLVGSAILTAAQNDFTNADGDATGSANSRRIMVTGAVTGRSQFAIGHSFSPYVNLLYATERTDAFIFTNNEMSDEAETSIGKIGFGIEYTKEVSHLRGDFLIRGEISQIFGSESVTLSDGEVYTPNEDPTGSLTIGWIAASSTDSASRVELTIGGIGDIENSEIRIDGAWNQKF